MQEMQQYEIKTLTIRAIRYMPDGSNFHAILDSAPRSTCAGPKVLIGDADLATIWVQTPNGAVRMDPGDWLIEGTMGEHYPCKDEVFQSALKEKES